MIRIRKTVPWMVTALAVLCAGRAIRGWLAQEASLPLLRQATADGSLAEASSQAVAARESDLLGCFKADRAVSCGSTVGRWTGFRGPARDNVAPGAGRLSERWPEEGPHVIWSKPLGDGHAMPALANGCLYLLDYDEARGGDCLRCLNADTGQQRWEHFYSVKTKRNHGISRTVAATDGDSVVTLGPQGQVLCLAAETGAYRWGLSLPARYGATVPLWYAGQCPLLDAGAAILAPAGSRVLLCGIELSSGKTVFETPGPGGLAMSHASVMVLRASGTRQFVYAALGGIVGVGADGPERGRLLWRTEAFRPSVVAPSPVPVGDGLFFMTAGYGSGGAMFRVTGSNGVWRADVAFKTDRKFFASEQQTPVFLNGLLFSVLPSDGGGDRQQLACMTPDGARLWTSGPSNTFGLGPYVATPDGLMLLLDDVGTLSLARVGRDGFTLLGRSALMRGKGRDAWGPMVLAGGRLYLRDSARLYCLRVGEP